jgi:type II secretory pathway pseudopilin PulG
MIRNSLRSLSDCLELGRGKRDRRAGFTLLELVVVVAIIMALAGLLVLVLPDVLTKANEARLIGNVTEMDKIIQSYQASHSNNYPDGFDSLLDSPTGGTLYKALPGGSTGADAYLSKDTLSAADLAKLNRVGITAIYHMLDPGVAGGARNATYMAGGTKVPLAEGTSVAVIDSTYAASSDCPIRLETGHKYVVFGVGRACSLIGPGGMVKDSPVIMHNDGCLDPKTVYCGVCAIFDLDPASTYRGASAKFVGCFSLGASGFHTSEQITNQVQ